MRTHSLLCNPSQITCGKEVDSPYTLRVSVLIFFSPTGLLGSFHFPVCVNFLIRAGRERSHCDAQHGRTIHRTSIFGHARFPAVASQPYRSPKPTTSSETSSWTGTSSLFLFSLS